jgi:hypothetical protein
VEVLFGVLADVLTAQTAATVLQNFTTNFLKNFL